MPSVPLYAPAFDTPQGSSTNPLPELLHTPAGLAIVEIQGSLHTPPPSNGDAGYTTIGKLVFPLYNPENSKDDMGWMKKVHLYVGKHQRLTGEVKKLGKGKCIGVVRKREGADPASEGEGLEIVDVVKYKMLFQGRPEPVDMVLDG